MEDKILELINAIIRLTKALKPKWEVGSEEGEYLLNLGEIGFLVNKKADVVSFSATDLKGNTVFRKAVSSIDPLYATLNDLYELALQYNEESSLVLDQLIEFLNKKQTSAKTDITE